ncbi:Mth938-like domain-containing protein [Acrocarpospora sp. B8E8]|uniref:Mth938-like domain-containing protein n=1 Tax=Acrocarpospora sp. B8E8 TaxID=3153572 RepID=UPI00325F6A9D
MDVRSPLITHISWGRMVVEGVGEGKDFKLYPGGGRAWDWNETGTRHSPGIQPADVEELLERGSEVIVLSRGMQLVLQTCPETLAMLKEKGAEVFVEETTAAVGRYNRLAATTAVGGLFHSTC